MSRTIELIAHYRTERHRFENHDSTHVIIAVQLHQSSKQTATEAGFADVDGYLTFRGDLVEEFTRGMAYRFLGVPSTYKRTGERQLNFRTYVAHIAHDPESIANYLAAAGRGNGIGPSKAQRIVNAFGVDSTLEVCRTEPDKVSLVAGISAEQANQFSAVLIDQQKTENATLELDKLLTGRGFPKSLPKKLIKEHGNRAAEIVTADPFILMNYQGVGFKRADTLYMQLGKDPRSLDRLALCLWYGMNSDNSGHTWFPAKYAVERLNREIGGADIDFRGAITRGKEFASEDPNHYGAIASMRTDAQGYPAEDGSLWLAEAKHDAAEQAIVDALQAAREESEVVTLTAWEQSEEITESIATAARCARCCRPLTAESVHILAGKPYGPTCIEYMGGCDEVVSTTDWLQRNPVLKREIIDDPVGFFTTPAFNAWPEPDSIESISDHQREQVANSMVGRIGILTGSPGTGKTYCVAQIIKAILRTGIIGIEDIGLGAPTGKAAVRLTETLSSAGIAKRARTWHSHLWAVDENGTLPYKILFGDECSMKDLPMMAKVLGARAPGCHVLLVGDPNQLAPVGPGAPFRDLIQAGVASGHLTEVQRNAGEIVEACARIRDGKAWEDLINRKGGNLHWHECSTPDESLDDLENALAGLPLWDAQVLVALNDKGPLCRQIVNTRLQQHYNADGQTVPGSRFRIGDKVVCLKNSWFESLNQFGDEESEPNARGEIYVANGELGEVIDQHTKGFVVRIESPRRSVIVPSKKETLDENNDAKESGTGSNWDLGYGLSVHKSQGSEFKHVFILVDDWPGARQVCDASWVITAKSRGRLHTHYFGRYATIERFCRVQRLDQRKTFLRERIIESQINLELSGL